MPRPVKPRRVESIPQVNYFKPTGVPMKHLEEVIISVDELEALRLKDMDGLEQHQCAEKMGVAQSTLQRILVTARKKLVEAIVEGKALRIEGGTFSLAGKVLCKKCQHGRHRQGLNGKDDREADKIDDECPVCGDKDK